MSYELRYATNPTDFKSYDTARLRKDFLIEDLFEADKINFVYSMYDRYITGGAAPTSKEIKLESLDDLKSDNFLDRREMGVINVGSGKGEVIVDGTTYTMESKDAMYIGKGSKDVTFKAVSGQPLFYINSTPAHKEFPTKHVSKKDADVITLGTMEQSNHRDINKMLVSQVIDTCQLQMGMTELRPGSVWNTMPPHTHDRRMEVYFYFDLPEGEVVSHFMGPIDETRHIWMKNNQAVISPSWSIHCGAGTSNYTFIWGMAGENLDYDDMDKAQVSELR
ncbi:MAG: 5-dehydro-4-deoxy-D-glucuronate isomerase [Cyclobacteriaceae bacterium]